MRHVQRRLGVVRRALLVAALLGALVIGVGGPAGAAAHPLGNFTVNLYSRLDLYWDVIRIRYVLDMAEIPTFQEMSAIDTDGDGEISEAEKRRYVTEKTDELRERLHLLVDGSRSRLEVLSRQLSFLPGQGGLDTMRLSVTLEAPTGDSELAIDYRDDNYARRLGWREVVVRPAQGVRLIAGTPPTEDVTNELRTYPDDRLSSPLNVLAVSFAFDPTAGALAPAMPTTTADSTAGGTENAFVSLIAIDDLSLPVVLIALLAAMGFGAVHALEPGHGKTLVGAYFVGVSGTARDAISLGLIIAVTHTFGVFVIGLVTLYGSSFIVPERLYPWLSLGSGLLVASLGLRLLLPRLGVRLRVRVPGLGHGHSHHGHWHEHAHSLPHATASGAGSGAPWRSLIALGLADGLVPSPSTLVVLLAAISLHRVDLGLLLIAAFSVGLAGVLTLVSLCMVYARRLAQLLSSSAGTLRHRMYLRPLVGAALPVARLVPAGSAVVLLTVGLFLAVRALSQPGLLGI